MPLPSSVTVPLTNVQPLGHRIQDLLRLAGRVLEGGAGVPQVHRRPDQRVDRADHRSEDRLRDARARRGQGDLPAGQTNSAPVAA
jgi:hypothetical protein